MTPATRRVLASALAVALATALPVFVLGRRGWPVAVALASAGALAVVAVVRAEYEDALRRLDEAVGSADGAPRPSAASLAKTAAAVLRDALDEAGRATAALARREEALVHTTDGVAVIDADGMVEYANPAARSIVHERLLDATRRLGSAELDRIVKLARDLGSVVTEEVDVRTPAVRQVLARGVPASNGDVVLILHDRSESHRLDRLRRDFVANVSHELKTPVAAVRALADVASSARDDGNEEAATRFIAKLRLEAERLSDLVADLLDLSSVESAKEVELVPVDAFEIAQTAAERARTIAEAKSVPVDVVGEETLLEADATQLTMAVQNLVDNAVHYSERGTVRITVSSDDGWVRIEVSDEGIGIPAPELPRIFERFYRVDRARSRATGGTGLGLAIVRHVVENHGGRVEVRSELGVGSAFTLVLPAGGTPVGIGGHDGPPRAQRTGTAA